MEQTIKQNLLKLFLLLIVCKVQISTCETRQVRCSMIGINTNCTISSLTLSLGSYEFKPVASNPSIVTNFIIIKSTVPVITSEICTALPKLNTFAATQQGIQVIEDYAFSNCSEIISIILPFNNIHKLGKGIFDNCKFLQKLNLHGGYLEQIDANLFENLNEMTELLLSGHKLKELPTAAIENMKKLEIFYIYSNELLDLDAAGIIRSCPNLKKIYINDNNFHCDRLQEIIAMFKSTNVDLRHFTHTDYLRKRDYFPHKVNNIICLTQPELESEKRKNVLNSSLDELKELPIGKAVIQLKDLVNSGFEDADSNIVNLSNMFNETSDILGQKIFDINETLNAIILKLQEIVKSEVSMTDLYNTTLLASSLNKHKFNENSNLTTVWVFLICLLVISVALSVFVYKKLRNIQLKISTLRFKDDIIYLNDDHQNLCST